LDGNAASLCAASASVGRCGANGEPGGGAPAAGAAPGGGSGGSGACKEGTHNWTELHALGLTNRVNRERRAGRGRGARGRQRRLKGGYT